MKFTEPETYRYSHQQPAVGEEFSVQTAKSINVQKQRTVSHLISNSIKTEQQAQMRVVQMLGRQQREKNEVAIFQKQVEQVQIKTILTYQRTQSSLLRRAQREDNRAQALKITSASNMINKIGIDRIREQQKRNALKSA